MLTNLLPAASLLGAGLFAAALRAWCYAQVEYVTAAMLSRNLKKAAKIIQLGGGTRELFYYPPQTIQVTAIGEDLNAGLMGQAGIQASIPVVSRKEPVTSLAQLGGSSADAVVSLSSLQHAGDLPEFFGAVLRVLSPGGRCDCCQHVCTWHIAWPLSSLASQVRLRAAGVAGRRVADAVTGRHRELCHPIRRA